MVNTETKLSVESTDRLLNRSDGTRRDFLLAFAQVCYSTVDSRGEVVRRLPRYLFHRIVEVYVGYAPNVLLLKDPDPVSTLYNDHLRHIGYQLVYYTSILSFQYLNQAILEEKLKMLHEFSGILLTSPRAATAIMRALERASMERNKMIINLHNTSVYTVGRALEDIGVTCMGKETGSAEKLAIFLTENHKCRTKPLLFLCGEEHREVIPTSFYQRREPLEKLIVYKSSQVKAINFPEDCLFPKWVVFFSPSGVAAASNSAFPWRTVYKAAIGKTTQRAMEEAAKRFHDSSWEADVVAQHPTPQGLSEAIAQYDAVKSKS